MKCHSFRIVAVCFAIVACLLIVSPAMAQGNGNGNGKGGGGNGGGGDEPVTYPPPPELSVRYRVKLIDLGPDTTSAFPQDGNDAGDLVGHYGVETTSGGERRVGYYFNSITEVVQTSDEMFAASSGYADIHFVGINNFGAIVGRATSFDDIYHGFLATPDENSTTGWSFELLPTPDNAEMTSGYGFYPRKINDVGDIIGLSFSESGTRAFCVNLGNYDASLLLQVVPVDIQTTLQTQVLNNGTGFLQSSQTNDLYRFDFDAARTLQDSDPLNDVDPLSGIVLPAGNWQYTSGYNKVAQDGQFVAHETVQISNKKGGIYATFPGVVDEIGNLVWEGSDGSWASHVNSREGSNISGDILISYPTEAGPSFPKNRMLHADWGMLDLDLMLVFDSPLDEEVWSNAPYPADISDFGDRDLETGFGPIFGYLNTTGIHFVLLPVDLP